MTGDGFGSAGRCWDRGVLPYRVGEPRRNVREGKEMLGLGEGKQMGAGGKERSLRVQRNRCWGVCRERRQGI